MRVGSCPRCIAAYPHPESNGPAVVTLTQHPGYVACCSCGTSWTEADFRAECEPTQERLAIP